MSFWMIYICISLAACAGFIFGVMLTQARMYGDGWEDGYQEAMDDKADEDMLAEVQWKATETQKTLTESH